jgi:hypothetical protein
LTQLLVRFSTARRAVFPAWRADGAGGFFEASSSWIAVAF